MLLITSLVQQAEKVFNQDMYFKKTVKYVGEPMTHLESIASSAVYFLRKVILVVYIFCAATNVTATMIKNQVLSIKQLEV